MHSRQVPYQLWYIPRPLVYVCSHIFNGMCKFLCKYFFLKLKSLDSYSGEKCNALTEYRLDGSWSELLSVKVKEIDVL